MINLLGRQLNSFTTALLALVAVVLLQGCGAERTTPFSPSLSSSSCSSSNSSSSSSTFITDASSSSSSNSSSSCSSSSTSNNSSSVVSSSSVSNITISKIWSAFDTIEPVEPKERNVRVIGNYDDFVSISAKYVLLSDINAGDYFTDGQVVLIYEGEINSCAAHLEFAGDGGINPGTSTDSSLKIILDYYEKKDADKCSPNITHPFSFYYIKSKKLLIFEDKIVQ